MGFVVMVVAAPDTSDQERVLWMRPTLRERHSLKLTCNGTGQHHLSSRRLLVTRTTENESLGFLDCDMYPSKSMRSSRASRDFPRRTEKVEDGVGDGDPCDTAVESSV